MKRTGEIQKGREAFKEKSRVASKTAAITAATASSAQGNRKWYDIHRLSEKESNLPGRGKGHLLISKASVL